MLNILQKFNMREPLLKILADKQLTRNERMLPIRPIGIKIGK